MSKVKVPVHMWPVDCECTYVLYNLLKLEVNELDRWIVRRKFLQKFQNSESDKTSISSI